VFVEIVEGNEEVEVKVAKEEVVVTTEDVGNEPVTADELEVTAEIWLEVVVVVVEARRSKTEATPATIIITITTITATDLAIPTLFFIFRTDLLSPKVLKFKPFLLVELDFSSSSFVGNLSELLLHCLLGACFFRP